jgi:site-specific recombinase
MDELRSRSRQWHEQGGHYVADRPVRSMVMAAAGGAAVTTLMLAALRGSRR